MYYIHKCYFVVAFLCMCVHAGEYVAHFSLNNNRAGLEKCIPPCMVM